MNAPQPPTMGDDIRRGINAVCLLAHAHAHCLYPFLRYGYGLQVPGFQGVMAVGLMWVACLYTEDLAILKFLGVWLVATIIQRVIAFYRHWRGLREHSHYEGYPWLAALFARGRGEIVARSFEPVLVVPAGLGLAVWSEPLGVFVLAGAVSLPLVLIISETAKLRRVTDMLDMELEQRALAERVRWYRNGS